MMYVKYPSGNIQDCVNLWKTRYNANANNAAGGLLLLAEWEKNNSGSRFKCKLNSTEKNWTRLWLLS